MSIASCLVGYYAGRKYPDQPCWNIATSVVMIHLGKILNNFNLTDKYRKITNTYTAAGITAIISAAVIIAVMSQYRIELSQNIIVNPLFFCIGGILGFILCLSFYFLEDSQIRKHIFSYIGRNSIWILSLHLLCFKLITSIQIAVFHLPIEYLKIGFTGVRIENWWIAHMLAGIILPLGISWMFRAIKGLNHFAI